jgi:two-component system response regulator YesN
VFILHKVLIIDDEQMIREGLKSIIDWEDLGFEIIGEASNGFEALKKIEVLDPDVILADIKMPFMDGISLTEKLKKMKKDFNIIFITAYSDFKFAKKAIDLGVSSYLLKPIDEDELTEILLKIKDEYNKDIIKNKRIINMTKEKFIEDYILDKIEKDKIEEYKGVLKLELSWKSYQIALFDINSSSKLNTKLKNNINNEIEKFINKNKFGITFNIYKFIGVLLKDEPFLIANRILFNFLERVSDEYNVDLIASIGSSVKHFSDLKESYDSALIAMNKKFIFGVNKIIKYDKYIQNNNESKFDKINLNYEEIYSYLDAGNREYINNYLEKLRDYYEISKFSEESIKIFYAKFYTILYNKIIDNYPEVYKQIKDERFILENIHKKSTLQSLHAFIKYQFLNFIDLIDNCKTGDKMYKIVKYIDVNYNKNLKLDNLASLFNYNSVYLGRLFKSHTGQYFNKYIDTIRINKAKELILDDMKVNEIAKKIGYKDIDYFYKKFKKYVGTSPTLYKKYKKTQNG